MTATGGYKFKSVQGFKDPNDNPNGRRKHKRHIPKKEIIVALISKCEDTVVGRVIDISKSGLALSYLPLENDESFIRSNMPCEYMLKFVKQPFTKPNGCKVVCEIELNSKESWYFVNSLRRCGISFEMLLNDSEIERMLVP
jgi:hypothetical protein